MKAYMLKLLIWRPADNEPNYYANRIHHASTIASAIEQAQADPSTLEVLGAEYLYTLGKGNQHPIVNTEAAND